MTHQVFISYATGDKPVADAACARLEQERIRCWIAPRDILPGSEWSEAIVRALEGARVVVLVLSSRTNVSKQVRREIERAVNAGAAILPLRIEDVRPSLSLEYFIGTQHWLDALSPPLERHLDRLVSSVRDLLAHADGPAAAPVEPSGRKGGSWWRPVAWIAGSAVAAGAAWLASAILDRPTVGGAERHAAPVEAGRSAAEPLRFASPLTLPVGTKLREEFVMRMTGGELRMTGTVESVQPAPGITVRQILVREVLPPRAGARQSLRVEVSVTNEEHGPDGSAPAPAFAYDGLVAELHERNGVWQRQVVEPVPEGFEDWMLSELDPWTDANVLLPAERIEVGDGWVKEGPGLAVLFGGNFVDPACRMEATFQERVSGEEGELAVIRWQMEMSGRLPLDATEGGTFESSMNGTSAVSVDTGLVVETSFVGSMLQVLTLSDGPAAGTRVESSYRLQSTVTQRPPD